MKNDWTCKWWLDSFNLISKLWQNWRIDLLVKVALDPKKRNKFNIRDHRFGWSIIHFLRFLWKMHIDKYPMLMQPYMTYLSQVLVTRNSNRYGSKGGWSVIKTFVSTRVQRKWKPKFLLKNPVDVKWWTGDWFRKTTMWCNPKKEFSHWLTKVNIFKNNFWLMDKWKKFKLCMFTWNCFWVYRFVWVLWAKSWTFVNRQCKICHCGDLCEIENRLKIKVHVNRVRMKLKLWQNTHWIEI